VVSPDGGDHADVTLQVDGGQGSLVAVSGSIDITQGGPDVWGSLDVSFADAGALRGTFHSPFCTP
jgi:hypothetical protein